MRSIFWNGSAHRPDSLAQARRPAYGFPLDSDRRLSEPGGPTRVAASERVAAQRPAPPVALGFRPHTGWAAMVAVADDGGRVEVVDRRRAALLDETLPPQVFHAAAALPAEEAEELIGRVRSDACDAAIAVFEEVAGALGDVLGVGVVAWQPAVPEGLDQILASHQLMHAAEGDLYRGALQDGADAVGLSVYQFLPADLPSTAAAAVGLTPQVITDELADLGRRVGPPGR